MVLDIVGQETITKHRPCMRDFFCRSPLAQNETVVDTSWADGMVATPLEFPMLFGATAPTPGLRVARARHTHDEPSL